MLEFYHNIESNYELKKKIKVVLKLAQSPPLTAMQKCTHEENPNALSTAYLISGNQLKYIHMQKMCMFMRMQFNVKNFNFVN